MCVLTITNTFKQNKLFSNKCYVAILKIYQMVWYQKQFENHRSTQVQTHLQRLYNHKTSTE